MPLVDPSPSLLAWFDRAARDLPWRRDRTAYRVWVSEVMLQQTRVATVIPYFERFVAEFPSVRALADAPLGDVLAAWSGLGYYRRARQLHAGAIFVRDELGGEMPKTAEELRAIPGIGPYTAGAIASLAHGRRTPLVDGNVARVYSRLFAIEDDVTKPKTKKAIWDLAARLVPEDRPGAYNEALMELGATICAPRDPACDRCPLASICEGKRRQIAHRLPVVTKAKKVPTVHVAALVERKGARVLLARRRGDALFGGLWEPPMVEANDEAAAKRKIARFASSARDAGHVTHVLSHRRMEIAVMTGASRAKASYPAIYDEVRFVAEDELGSYGTSTLARKVLRVSRGRS